MTELQQAATAIADAATVAIVCHVDPDGDALGSALGLAHVLWADGRDCSVSFPAPFIVAPHYRELPGLDRLTPPEEFPRAPDVMVTFDCASLDRLEELGASAKAAGELIVVDHHKSNDHYGTINIIDGRAPASGFLTRALIAELGLPLNDAAAVCLYTALVCDTGRFQYATTTPAVFEMARELSEFQVPIERLSRQLFEEHSFAYLHLLAEAISNAELVPEQKFVWTAVTQDMLKRHGVTLDEIEGLVDVLRTTAEAEITCICKEQADGTIKVSLRSLSDLDVSRVASDLGGGGHRHAAGFTLDLPIPAVVEAVRAAL